MTGKFAQRIIVLLFILLALLMSGDCKKIEDTKFNPVRVQVSKEQCTITHYSNVIEINNGSDHEILFVLDVEYTTGEREYELAYTIRKDSTWAIRVRKEVKSVKAFFCVSMLKCFTLRTGQNNE